jgi:hypothetical protein
MACAHFPVVFFVIFIAHWYKYSLIVDTCVVGKIIAIYKVRNYFCLYIVKYSPH